MLDTRPETRPIGDYDPQLLRPRQIQPGPPPPRLSTSQRTELEREKSCLVRERDTIQTHIDHLDKQLAA